MQVRKADCSISYNRLVVKAGTALLTHGSDHLNLQIMSTLVDQIARLHRKGTQIMLVSSGAVAAGRHVLKAPREGKNVPFKQVLAAAGQGQLIHTYEQLFGWHEIPVAQALLSGKDLNDRLGYLNVRNTLLSLLDLKVIPIINENDVVAVDELAGEVFGDNDGLSSMVANLVDADLLVMLGEVDGLYTSDPNINPNAKLIPLVEDVDPEIQSMGGAPQNRIGRGGMAAKLKAAKLATASGVEVVIANGLEEEILTRLCRGERIGTYFSTTNNKMESRKRWILSGLSMGAEIVIDDGACNMLSHRNSSLLPAGVKEVRGKFDRGETVSIVDSKRTRIAAGTSNYGSEELHKIMGAQSNRIGEILGHQYGEEVIHRSNMVVL